MDAIKDIVKKVFTDISINTVGEQKKIDDVFIKVFEKNTIEAARISGLKERHLFVNVDSPARLYQANLKKQKILEELQKEIPDIQKISFKIGKVT